MRVRAAAAAALAVALALSGTATAAPPSSPGATLDAFHAALTAGRTEDASALLGDGLLVYEAGHAERSKAEYAGHHLPADAAFAKGTSMKVLKHDRARAG